MNYFKAFFLFFFTCFVYECCFAQVIIDPAVTNKYRDAVKRVPKVLAVLFTKEMAPYSTDSAFTQADPLGYAIITIYKYDTLNKKELTYSLGNAKIIITDIDEIAGKADLEMLQKERMINPEEPYYPNFMAGAVLKQDSLLIVMTEIFGPEVSAAIVGKSVSANYRLYRKNEPIFRLHLNDPKISDLSVPMHIAKITLSDKNYTENQNIHGEAEFITDPFFSDSTSFTSGYLAQQVHIKYLFHLKIRSSQVIQ